MKNTKQWIGVSGSDHSSKSYKPTLISMYKTIREWTVLSHTRGETSWVIFVYFYSSKLYGDFFSFSPWPECPCFHWVIWIVKEQYLNAILNKTWWKEIIEFRIWAAKIMRSIHVEGKKRYKGNTWWII
jgi:hypothetical protein